MVAGSTMSAMRAVSVMTCSCTTVNRSSRAKPRLTTSWSGATVTGLVFWMNSAVTGGPPRSASASPVSTAPMRDWSSWRTPASRRSSPSISGLVPAEHAGIGMQRAAARDAASAPSTTGNRRHGMHGGRAVARAGKAVADAEEGARPLPEQTRRRPRSRPPARRRSPRPIPACGVARWASRPAGSSA